MYTLFIANKNYSSWSLRPWLLMKQLGIAFDEQTHVFNGQVNWDRFRQFAPNGRVPCLHDGNTIVWDSLAITEYLAESHERVWPNDRIARAWTRSASAEMHSGFNALRGRCPMNVGIRLQLHSIEPELQRDLDRIMEIWQDGLNRFGGPFLSGAQFSAVDAFFAPVCFRIQSYNLPINNDSQRYQQLILNLPATRLWYDAALAETMRDEPHDRETLKAGTLLQDLRAKG